MSLIKSNSFQWFFSTVLLMLLSPLHPGGRYLQEANVVTCVESRLVQGEASPQLTENGPVLM